MTLLCRRTPARAPPVARKVHRPRARGPGDAAPVGALTPIGPQVLAAFDQDRRRSHLAPGASSGARDEALPVLDDVQGRLVGGDAWFTLAGGYARVRG